MATIESTMNDALAHLLRYTRRAWRGSSVVSSENTGMLVGSNKRPDILVCEPTVSPVTIETEVLPAITVEKEAIERLGETVSRNGRTILSSIGVRLPIRLKKLAGTALSKELASAIDLEFALFTGSSPHSYSRWPHSGWLKGTVSDLSLLSQAASVPPDVIEQAADHLVTGVSEAAGLIAEIAQSHPGAMAEICKELRQHDDEQTRRMAAIILANAFAFQENLARGPGELSKVLSVEELRSSSTLNKSAVLLEWRKILKVNYWPIFDIARRMLEVIPAAPCKPLIDRLTRTADKLVENQLMRSHDLTGAVFQKLIADRKFLAAYYTTPASAALLVGLAITSEHPLTDSAWGDPAKVKALRIGDLACGTGTLLSTAYSRVGQLHELAGGDSETIHAQMMAHSVVGCDVLPAAAHLTASMLSGSHPAVRYEGSMIMTVAFGKQADESIALGSLDLLDAQGKLDVVAVTAKSLEATGESQKDLWKAIPHAQADEPELMTFDVIIMNPPFTRSTGHEGKKINVPRPMFAAFGSSKEEQKLMAKATKRLTAGTSAHGNAGEASIFLVLADRKIKPGGVLALVMPLSLISGEAWEESRKLLAKQYENLIVLSIAGAGSEEMSFSADTGMGECLVIGEKTGKASSRAILVVLKERPAYPLLGATIAVELRRLVEAGDIRRLEDGPVGGTPLLFGNDVVGQAIDAPLPETGSWNPSRIADLSLAQSAHQLANFQRIWLPGMEESKAKTVPITEVSKIGEIGPYHADINGNTAKGGIRGPFLVSDLPKGSVPTYPVLWSHDATRETRMQFDADSQAQPKHPANAKEKAIIEFKINSIVESFSHCHFNQNFQFNSQPTPMQFTARPTIGGRAWISVRLPSKNLEKALVVWGNSTLGFLSHWYHANKQQSGRGNIGRTALQTLPVLDVTALTDEQLNAAVAIFDDLKAKDLLPIHQIDVDKAREELDRRFAAEVLGLPKEFASKDGPLDLLRMKLAQEPSIRGGKAGEFSVDDLEEALETVED
jgi:hypothetical protein